LRLPSFEELSPEQDEVYNLPLDGNYLVSGPPGSGKSNMALYRALALGIDERPVTVIMYNRVLKQYTVKAAGELGLNVDISTFHEWMWKVWKRFFGDYPPTHVAGEWAIDWSRAVEIFLRKLPSRGALPYLIVDEGQDLPVHFYTMASWLSKGVTVFADENQVIRDGNSTLAEIGKSIAAAGQIHLSRSHRNTREIARIASLYRLDGRQDMVTVEEDTGVRPALVHVADLEEFAAFVERYTETHPSASIAIACKTANLQRRLWLSLGRRRLKARAQMYISTDSKYRRLTFDETGVTIINYRSMKGLEFDTVLVPELQLVEDAASPEVKTLFYVVMSRARHELLFFWSGSGTEPDVLANIPEDVLERC
jgi:DNA helicase IV